MKFFSLFVALVFLAPSLLAAEVHFYLGTYTNKALHRGIYQGTLDTETGKLSPLQLEVEASDPNFLALAPDGKTLYAALRVGDHEAAGAFTVRPDGGLVRLNDQPSGGKDTCHISVDHTGHAVLIANYGTGSIACFPVNADHSLGARTELIPFTGSGPNLSRQKAPHAHSIYVSPDNAFVYACDLGTDHVWIFKFDPMHARLVPDDPPFAQVPPGSGPRHLLFSPDGKFVYVAGEMGCNVTVFRHDAASGALTPLQTVSTLPTGTATKGLTASEIVLHPSGKWLYVSNRGCDTISVFAIDGEGGLALLETVPALVQIPRSFSIDPTGRWLISAGQKDNRIAVLKIDPASGRLSATDQSATVGSPVCVLFEGR